MVCSQQGEGGDNHPPPRPSGGRGSIDDDKVIYAPLGEVVVTP